VKTVITRRVVVVVAVMGLAWKYAQWRVATHHNTKFGPIPALLTGIYHRDLTHPKEVLLLEVVLGMYGPK
jgi:hypothetical protein